jgi:peptide/nickel transport system substrate-binding protein
MHPRNDIVRSTAEQGPKMLAKHSFTSCEPVGKMHTTSLSALALFCVALSAGSIDAAAQAQSPRRGDTAIFALSGDPTSVNPDISTNIPDRQIGCILYQGLVEVSDDYRILPLLAKSWTISPDGLVYDFMLNQVKWHDGKPFTAEDVKYSLVEVSAKYSSIFGPAGRVIDTIETPSADRVVIKLKQPFGPFLISLGCIQGAAIVPAHLFRGTNVLNNPANTTSPVGTGPFKLAEWRRGDFVRLARNPDYFEQGKPYLDGIIGKIIPQGSSRTQALQAGEIDLLQFPPPNDVAALGANAKLKVVDSDLAPLSSLAFFNLDRKPLDAKRVRHALFMATDRDYLLKNAFFGIGSIGEMPFPNQISWAKSPDVDYRKMYPFDPARANALLDSAGLARDANGRRFALHITVFGTQYPDLQQAAVAMKSMWRAVGVDVTIDALEDATYVKRVFTDRDFDIALVTYTSYSDPALGVVRTFSTATVGRPFGNPSGYSNPKVDELFVQGERAIAPETRGLFYRQAQAILADDLPVLQLRQYVDKNVASKSLQGLWGSAQGNGHWVDAWLSQ